MPTPLYLWISYDLGIRGDYDGLYAWLDEYDARECGDSLALIRVTVDGDVFSWLREELEEVVDLTKRSRLYAIVFSADERRLKARFVFGNRKSPPWSGFGPEGEQEDEIDEDA